MLKRVVLGVAGASGAAIAMRIGELLCSLPDVELHLVVSEAGKRTLAYELGPDALTDLIALAPKNYPANDIGATIASGSFKTAGMIVAPCSMRSLAAIATGLSDNLLTRAADVHLKERRKLVLLARETPLHIGHLRNMVAVTEMGATILPPVPAFYRQPKTIADIVDHIAARAVDQLDLGQAPLAVEWDGNA
ncbi:UbiX family flavin prenyltransferase [Rhizobium wenxiniae]|uniref:UbiX family flavin prenyltransferase n=1 Tax=Rhizobium wenxiniae TaxID=1737357 RepID=UPI0031FC9C9C